MHSTVKMSTECSILPSFSQNRSATLKKAAKMAATRPIFYAVFKKLIFTTVGNIYWPKKGFKVLSVYTLQPLATFTTVQVWTIVQVWTLNFTCYLLQVRIREKKKLGQPDINCYRNWKKLAYVWRRFWTCSGWKLCNLLLTH